MLYSFKREGPRILDVISPKDTKGPIYIIALTTMGLKYIEYHIPACPFCHLISHTFSGLPFLFCDDDGDHLVMIIWLYHSYHRIIVSLLQKIQPMLYFKRIQNPIAALSCPCQSTERIRWKKLYTTGLSEMSQEPQKWLKVCFSPGIPETKLIALFAPEHLQ